MANNVYIGMRYVPKFVGNWDTTMQTVYEPLSIVMYNNSTYTSKKEVPTGTNITDTDYWVLTGNYNGQISNLQNQIDALQIQANDIEDVVKSRNLELTKMILLTDSFGENVTPNISTLIPQYLGISNTDVYTHVQGGCGFGPSSPYHYLTELQGMTISDPDKVKLIVVTGGSNDVGYNDTKEALDAAFNSFMTYVKTTYPNAKVFVAFTGWTNDYTSPTFNPVRFKTVLEWYRQLIKYNAYLIDSACLPLHVNSNFNGDGVHPTVQAQKEIAEVIANQIMTGSPAYHKEIVPTFTAASGITAEGDLTFKMDIDNNNGRVAITAGASVPAPRIVFSNPVTLQQDHLAEQFITLGTFNDTIIGNDNHRRYSKTVVCQFNSTELNTPVSCTFFIQANTLFVKPALPFGTYTNVTIYLESLAIDFDMFEV